MFYESLFEWLISHTLRRLSYFHCNYSYRLMVGKVRDPILASCPHVMIMGDASYMIVTEQSDQTVSAYTS